MFLVGGLLIFVVEQYIKPTLEGSIEAMDMMKTKFDIALVMEKLLKLSIPNTYAWLLMFYFYFHLWLNFLAEITRFGDRLFYKDWWNSRTIENYWRCWNVPVHNWMLRHLYHPLIRAGAPKMAGTLAVFFFSAVFHEYIISTPFRMYTMHVFIGMMAQAPLIFITKLIDKTFDNSFVGNAIFWSAFCVVGQPMGIILVNYDLFKWAKMSSS
jgi:diacylglycerol O-acyltransferase-1